MKKRVLIVDSYEEQIKRIAQEVRVAAGQARECIKIYTAQNIEEAVTIVDQSDIDLLILDTVYKGTSKQEKPGIRWVEQLRKTEKYIPLPIIFITSLKEQEKYAYIELNCMGYFSRDFESENLQKVLKKALHYFTPMEEERHIFVKQRSIVYPVKIKDIVYVEAGNRLVFLYLNDGTKLEIPYISLNVILNMTRCKSIIQCSKYNLVNTYYIEKVERYRHDMVLYLEKGDLKVGRKYMKAVSEYINCLT